MLTEMMHLALPTAWNARHPSEWIWVACEIWYHQLTDRRTNQPPAYPGPTVLGGRAGGLDKEADW